MQTDLEKHAMREGAFGHLPKVVREWSIGERSNRCASDEERAEVVSYGLVVPQSVVGEGASDEYAVDGQPGQHDAPSKEIRGEEEDVEQLPGDV